MSQGTAVLFVSKEAKLCIDVIHLVIETIRNKSKKGKIGRFPFHFSLLNWRYRAKDRTSSTQRKRRWLEIVTLVSVPVSILRSRGY